MVVGVTQLRPVVVQVWLSILKASDRLCRISSPSGESIKQQGSAPMGDRDADQILVERVQSGDRQAFGLLVTKYQRKLLRLVSRLVRDPAEAEDVAQEAFIKAYRALPNFRGESAF